MNNNSNLTNFAYVGTCPKCSSMCCAAVDDTKHAAETAKYVAEWIKKGLIVTRVTKDEVRASFASCKCKQAQKMPDNQPRLF